MWCVVTRESKRFCNQCTIFVSFKGVPQRRNRVYMVAVKQSAVTEDTLYQFGEKVKERVLNFRTETLNVVDFCELADTGLTDARVGTYKEVCDKIKFHDDPRVYGVCVTNSYCLSFMKSCFC